MLTVTYVVLYTGSAFYVLAALMALLYLHNANPLWLGLSSRALMAGILFFVAAFALRWWTWGRLPLTTMTESIDLFAVLTALAILFIMRKNTMPALLSFYLPPLAAICLVNVAFAHRFLGLEPRELRSSFLAIHVGLAFLAYALFYLASMTSAAYLCQASHLKHHRVSWLARHLPSLKELDAALFRLIRYGYPFFVVTLTLGLAWAFIDRNLLGPYWWASPKVVLSYAMAAFYASMFHLGRTGRLRGPKLAQLVFLGFFLLIVSYVALSILNLRGHYFWSGGS